MQVIYARPCICGKHMLEEANEDVCLWCGHGSAHALVEHAYHLNMEHNGGVALARPPSLRVVVGPAPNTIWDEDRCVTAATAWEQAHGHFPTSTEWAESRHGDLAHPSASTIIRRFGGWTPFRQAVAEVPLEQRLAA